MSAPGHDAPVRGRIDPWRQVVAEPSIGRLASPDFERALDESGWVRRQVDEEVRAVADGGLLEPKMASVRLDLV